MKTTAVEEAVQELSSIDARVAGVPSGVVAPTPGRATGLDTHVLLVHVVLFPSLLAHASNVVVSSALLAREAAVVVLLVLPAHEKAAVAFPAVLSLLAHVAAVVDALDLSVAVLVVGAIVQAVAVLEIASCVVVDFLALFVDVEKEFVVCGSVVVVVGEDNVCAVVGEMGECVTENEIGLHYDWMKTAFA